MAAVTLACEVYGVAHDARIGMPRKGCAGCRAERRRRARPPPPPGTLVVVHGARPGFPMYRRDCANIGPCEITFVAAHGSRQGACPKACPAFASRVDVNA